MMKPLQTRTKRSISAWSNADETRTYATSRLDAVCMIALDLCALIPCPRAEDEASVRQHHVPLICSAGRLECMCGQPNTASEYGDTTVTAISSASVVINVLVRPCLQLHVTCAPFSGPRIVPIRALREPKSRPPPHNCYCSTGYSIQQ